MASTSLPADGKVRKPAWHNQRATVRYLCAPATSSRVFLSTDMEFQRAWVQDLSSNGAGLAMSKALGAGLLVTIQLRAPSSKKTYELSAHVAHSTRLGNDWLIGCEFLTPLSSEDLDDLLY